MRWPHEREIEHMTSTEAYELYYGLPAPANAGQLALIRALGNHGWKTRQEEEAGRPQRQILPMPEPVPAEAKAQPLTPRPKFKPKPKPATQEERPGGASFFLAGLKL